MGERRKSVVEIRCGMSRTSPFFGQVKDLSSIKKIESTCFYHSEVFFLSSCTKKTWQF